MQTKQANNTTTNLRPGLFAPALLGRNTLYAALFIAVLVFLGCRSDDSADPCSPTEPNATAPSTVEQPRITPSVAAQEPNAPQELITAEMSLFDGKSLGKWQPVDFGGQGEVLVKDGAIHMETGNDMTGIKWTGPLIRMDYEISLDAMRVAGSDFFCGLTFPFGDRACSLVLGGWGGGLCGISNIDYYDAANNQTTRMHTFETGKWYHVRLRITPDKIEAWLDGEVLVNINVKGRHIDVRAEMDLTVPFGIATWQTAGAVRSITIKPVTGGPELSEDEEF
ncbi:MAG: DUF1080 domain-containing protein [Sedimentisphaerales bacterium]|nr:DUF1080 domain-containing protein [Sedimentisphaerales bacterium]